MWMSAYLSILMFGVCLYIFADGVHGGVGQWCAEDGLDEQFGSVLEGNHHQQVVCRHYAEEGYEYEGQTVEEVGHCRAAYGAPQRRLLPVIFFIFSISQALESSPKRKPVSEATTMRGTYEKMWL